MYLVECISDVFDFFYLMCLVVEERAREADGTVTRLAVILDGFSTVNAAVILPVVIPGSCRHRQHRVALGYLVVTREH